jgi:hypothetical protein
VVGDPGVVVVDDPEWELLLHAVKSRPKASVAGTAARISRRLVLAGPTLLSIGVSGV